MVRCAALLFHSLYYEAKGCNTKGKKSTSTVLQISAFLLSKIAFPLLSVLTATVVASL
jgi:hypothetical protein